MIPLTGNAQNGRTQGTGQRRSACPERGWAGRAGPALEGPGRGLLGAHRGAQGPGSPHVRGTAFPSPHPLPPAQPGPGSPGNVCGVWLLLQETPRSSLGLILTANQPILQPVRIRGFRLRLGGLGDSTATSSLTWTLSFLSTQGTYPSTPLGPRLLTRFPGSTQTRPFLTFPLSGGLAAPPPENWPGDVGPTCWHQGHPVPLVTMLLQLLHRPGRQACTPWRSRACCPCPTQTPLSLFLPISSRTLSPSPSPTPPPPPGRQVSNFTAISHSHF